MINNILCMLDSLFFSNNKDKRCLQVEAGRELSLAAWALSIIYIKRGENGPLANPIVLGFQMPLQWIMQAAAVYWA